MKFIFGKKKKYFILIILVYVYHHFVFFAFTWKDLSSNNTNIITHLFNFQECGYDINERKTEWLVGDGGWGLKYRIVLSS